MTSESAPRNRPGRNSVYSPAVVVNCLGRVNPPQTVTIFSPAKVNLFLAVTGRRADGYHDLVSVVAPLTFGDELTAEVRDQPGGAGSLFSLECDEPAVPRDDTNLVLRAAAAFAGATGWSRPVAFRLTKRIPLAAGLGGGSSNAVAALRALDQLSGAGLSRVTLTTLAAGVGSDCPLFLSGTPVAMRGRGERVEPLPDAATRRLRGRGVLLFKPALGISTAWAYARLAASAKATEAGAVSAGSAAPGAVSAQASTSAGPAGGAAVGGGYLAAGTAERRLAAWIAGKGAAEELLFNNLEPVVFQKYVALPTLLGHLRRDFGLAPLMSGSGSACFALLPEGAPVEAITACIREAWGSVCFVQAAALA